MADWASVRWRRSERRGSLRVPVRLPLTEVVGDRPVAATTVDIGQGGMAVEGAPSVPHGEIVGIELPLPGAGEPIRAEVTGESAAPDRRGVARTGLRFVSMSGRDQRLLRDFLADRRLRALEPRPPFRLRHWLRRLAG